MLDTEPRKYRRYCKHNPKSHGKTPDVQWDNSKPTTIPFRSCSTERIETELGFKPDYTFDKV